MSQRKRKSEEFSEEDSFKQNRSSLNVNLSCTGNLTDSGNGSFKTMELVGHNTLADSLRITRSSRNRSRLKTVSSKNICLKEASVVLEDISRADKSLSIRSKKLTDAILSKTKEIFPNENELSRKTSAVLENNETSLPESVPSHGNSYQSEKNQLFHEICTTPRKLNVSNRCHAHDKRQVHQREKYFTNKYLLQEQSDNRNGRINASPPTHNRSPILSQSRRKLNTSKFLLPKPKRLGIRNNNAQSQSQSLTSSILSDESLLAGFPLACSSMLEDCTNSQSKECAGVESMEMTDVRGGFIVEKSNILQCRSDTSTNSSITHKSTENDITTEHNLAASKRLSAPIIRKSQNQYSTKQQECNKNNLSSTVQTNSDDVEESINSLRYSLNVNTSIDVINENKKAYRRSKENRQSNSDVQVVNDSCQTISEQEQESVNTVNTSIQMNTSLRGPYRSPFIQDDTKQSHRSKNSMGSHASHGTSSIETVQIYNKENSANITRNNENMIQKQQESEEQNVTIRNKSKTTVRETVAGKSYIEPTPYPPTRSMMWKSLAKQNTEMQSLQNDNVDTTSHMTNVKRRGLQEYKFNIAQKDIIMSQIERNIVASIAKNTTINLDDSGVTRLPPRNIKHAVIVVDSDAEISQTKDTDAISTGPKRQRKKLLPMRENSGLLSFSPIDDSASAPTQSIFPKTRKKITKKDTKRKTKNVALHDSSIKQTQKEPKRIRRIKSKKITIKKPTNVDILKTLERERREAEKNLNSTGYNTASPSDFETKKYISTAKSARGLARKVVIVTTGLSKEDKALVKSVIKSIGKAKMEASVSPHTTYVVTTGVRTLNLLHGIIRGCWLVTMEWVLKSLENKQWLNPAEYEIPHFSKAVTANRKERMRAEQFGVSHVPDLFAATGLIYVENGTTPPSKDLKDLIKVGGGRITEDEHSAKTIVGSMGLKESWILDCITTGELQPYTQYKRN